MPKTVKRPRGRALRIPLVVVALLVAGAGGLGSYFPRARFLDGPATKTAGVNGAFLGPTIRAHRGENVRFTVHNGPDGPRQTVAPGDVRNPDWTVARLAATLWYHPHPLGKTAEHAYHCHLLTHEDEGMVGQFVVLGDGEEIGSIPGHDHP